MKGLLQIACQLLSLPELPVEAAHRSNTVQKFYTAGSHQVRSQIQKTRGQSGARRKCWERDHISCCFPSRPVGWLIQAICFPKPPDKTEKTELWILLPRTHSSFWMKGKRGGFLNGENIYFSFLWVKCFIRCQFSSHFAPIINALSFFRV